MVSNLGIDRLLVGPLGPHTIFNIIGGLPGPYSPTPLLLHLCYMYLYTLKSVLKGSPFRDSLYTVLIAQSLLHNTTLYLHVPSSCGHHIFSISDILFIKKYPEMGCRYFRIVSSRKGLLYRYGQSMSQVLIFTDISSPNSNDSEISLLNISA